MARPPRDAHASPPPDSGAEPSFGLRGEGTHPSSASPPRVGQGMWAIRDIVEDLIVVLVENGMVERSEAAPLLDALHGMRGPGRRFR